MNDDDHKHKNVNQFYHNVGAENPKNVIEEETHEKNATNLVATDRYFLNRLDAERDAKDIVHQEMFCLNVNGGEYDRQNKANNFCRSQKCVDFAQKINGSFETVFLGTGDK